MTRMSGREIKEPKIFGPAAALGRVLAQYLRTTHFGFLGFSGKDKTRARGRAGPKIDMSYFSDLPFPSYQSHS